MYFINNWNELSGAWSGTPNGLYNALLQKTDVKLVDVAKNNGMIQKIYNKLTMSIGDMRRVEEILNSNGTAEGDKPIFCFAEYYTKGIKNTYCFQDLTVDYVLRLRKNKSPNAKYALDTRTLTVFAEKRRKAAQKFYADCAGIFTMSEFLKEDLIKNMGVSAEKVHNVGGGCNIDVGRIDHSKKKRETFFVCRENMESEKRSFGSGGF